MVNMVKCKVRSSCELPAIIDKVQHRCLAEAYRATRYTIANCGLAYVTNQLKGAAPLQRHRREEDRELALAVRSHDHTTGHVCLYSYNRWGDKAQVSAAGREYKLSDRIICN